MTYTTESFPVIFVFETSCGSIISTMSDDSSATSDITPRPIDLTNPTSPVLTPAPVVQRAPRPADEAISLSSIWESDMIETFHEEKRNKSTGVMQLVSRWRCHHCMEDWAGNNATKVLRHVCGIKKDQRSCPAMIPTNYHHAYMSLLHSKMEAKTDRAMRQEILDMNLATTDSRTALR